MYQGEERVTVVVWRWRVTLFNVDWRYRDHWNDPVPSVSHFRTNLSPRSGKSCVKVITTGNRNTRIIHGLVYVSVILSFQCLPFVRSVSTQKSSTRHLCPNVDEPSYVGLGSSVLSSRDSVVFRQRSSVWLRVCTFCISSQEVREWVWVKGRLSKVFYKFLEVARSTTGFPTPKVVLILCQTRIFLELALVSPPTDWTSSRFRPF